MITENFTSLSKYARVFVEIYFYIVAVFIISCTAFKQSLIFSYVTFYTIVFHFVNIVGMIVAVELAIQDYQANRTEGATRPKEFVEFTTPAPPPALAENC